MDDDVDNLDEGLGKVTVQRRTIQTQFVLSPWSRAGESVVIRNCRRRYLSKTGGITR